MTGLYGVSVVERVSDVEGLSGVEGLSCVNGVDRVGGVETTGWDWVGQEVEFMSGMVEVELLLHSGCLSPDFGSVP